MRAIVMMISIAAVSAASNMNGEYMVTSVGDVGAKYNTDYSSKGYEYFDVWGPEIATHYGEVFWTDQGTQSLAEDIIKRFDGKVIAIQGYEQDQVMVSPVGKPGANPNKDVSVPINWAYNHHYCAWMGGKHSERKYIDTPGDIYGGGAHGMEKMWATVDKEDQSGRKFADVAQTSWFISEGNGGESRKSFHGYPEGFAQLIESPQNWHITPMQIDTRNRVHGVQPEDVHKCTNFSGVGENGKPCAGFEPRQARYGRGWGGVDGTPKNPGHYSGILECPCNSRYGGDPEFYPTAKTKELTRSITAIPSGGCTIGQTFSGAQACYDAIAELGFNATKISNKTDSEATMPSGCVFVKNADGSAEALYNTGGTATGAPSSKVKEAGSTSAVNKVSLGMTLSEDSSKSAMSRGPKGQYCSKNKENVLKEFKAKSTSTADTTAALAACEAFCTSDDKCDACSVDEVGYLQWAAIPDCGSILSWPGAIPGDISTKATNGDVTITLTGPADRYFAVGFGAKIMFEQPYTIVVNSSGVSEYKLGTCGTEANHCAGTPLAKSVKIVSDTVVDNRRTVVLTRPMTGASKDHRSFSLSTDSTMNYISAIGAQAGAQEFGYHGPENHDSLTLSFSPPTGPTVVCNLGETGDLCWNPAVVDGSGAWGAPTSNKTLCSSFKKGCVAHQPTLGKAGTPVSGDLLSQRNPTCNSGQYSGGLTCCKHKRLMLDADQTPSDDLLRYHMKFRFWYQEYKPNGPPVSKGVAQVTNASHIDLPRIYWQTEANAGEYDIPPAFYKEGEPKIVGYPNVGPYPDLTPGTTCTGNCPDGPDCDCVHTITYNNTVNNMRLIYAGGHCHAPACIGIWLYRNDPGHEMELLCHQVPVYGNGTGTNSVSGMYDEAGYLSLPPCLWGDEPGLHPSVLLPPNTPLVSIKKNHNTRAGHFGEMASWQMRGISH